MSFIKDIAILWLILNVLSTYTSISIDTGQWSLPNTLA